MLGAYTVRVTVTDDDGGVDETETVVDVGGAGAADPRPVPAIWANSRTARNAVDLTGAMQTYEGLVHSNNDIRLTGDPKTLEGGTEHVNGFQAAGGPHTVNPAPATVTPAGSRSSGRSPTTSPGRPAALLAGAAFHDMSAACRGQWRQPVGTLPDGLYGRPAR